MLINYKSVTGDYIVEVADGDWNDMTLDLKSIEFYGDEVSFGEFDTPEAFSEELDRIAYNTGRHRGVSLDAYNEYGNNVRSHYSHERELELREMREQALASLKPENRELWCRRYIENMSVKEIAALEGKTERAIQRRLSRINDTLKKYYEKHFL